MHGKVEKIGVGPINISWITLSSDELCSIDIAPHQDISFSIFTKPQVSDIY